ncbi:hypothetical protein LCGC14_0726630 [marine sediment metagenome]|uniref:Uncharacterized protein n=1 Tax=marine sediment metagenome TaxID=412755 RepID=A0A0F9QVU2_9ZZZZ
MPQDDEENEEQQVEGDGVVEGDVVEEEDKLLKIREEMILPVGLSELEKEKLINTFDGLKEWLDDAKDVVLKKPRLEAYRYVELLIAHLQMADVDYVVGASIATPATQSDPLAGLERSEVAHIERSAIKSPVVTRPTKEQVDGWIESMNPRVRSKLVRLLDCFKQYLDPESDVGIDIICNYCTPEEIVKCIRVADPSIVDASTVFMQHQTK